MTDLTFIIAVVIVNLIIAQVAFVILRYFTLKRQRKYENELSKLINQVEKGKLSQLLFRQMKKDLREKYRVAFFERWWRGDNHG